MARHLVDVPDLLVINSFSCDIFKLVETVKFIQIVSSSFILLFLFNFSNCTGKILQDMSSTWTKPVYLLISVQTSLYFSNCIHQKRVRVISIDHNICISKFTNNISKYIRRTSYRNHPIDRLETVCCNNFWRCVPPMSKVRIFPYFTI